MLNDKYKVEKVGFPNPLATDSKKKELDFGLSVGKAIESEWFRRFQGNCRFYTNQNNFHKLRLYARGEQSVQKYKNEMAINGDLSYINIDWTPVPIIPKFVDIIVNGMENRLYTVKTNAIDKLASDRRNKYIVEMEKDMVAKEMLEEAQQELGVNAFVNDPLTLPENNEELEVHMQLNYKQGVEIAQEEAISNIFEYNDYDDVKRRLDYDLTVLGVAFAKHTFNNIEGIGIEYVDAADMVYSHTFSDSPYFDDCYYFGEVKRVSLNELKKIQPNLTKDDLEKIKNNSSDWDSYHKIDKEVQSNFDDHTATLLFFNYKTTKDIVYKKKANKRGGHTVIRKDSEWNPPKDKMRGSERLVKTIDVWYEGVMVLGTNYILKWNLCENMIRPKSATHKTLPNYIGVAPRYYNGKIESQVQRMIPFADLIQLTHLKLQQVLARVVPDGVYIDADGLNEVNLGDGNAYNPKKALELYLQTGSVVGRSLTSEGELNHGKVPIQELSHNSGSNKIQSLITSYNYYLQMIRDVTGLNEARDASMPDSDTLVGVQKLAALNSNNATKHILNGGLYITEKLSECISYRISDIINNSDMKEQFISSIGKNNVSILEDMKHLHLHEFGIYIELSPDEEQKQMLENNIQQALSKDQIYLEDAIDVRQIQNLKLANQVLKIRRKKKEEQDIEKQNQAIQAQSQSAIQASKEAAKSKQVEIESTTQSKIAIDTNLKDLEARNLKLEAEVKERLMMKEFEINMALQGQQSLAREVADSMKEDRKDKRQDRNNSQQFKMKQAKEGDSPINFESNEDSLDGFSLEEFEPR